MHAVADGWTNGDAARVPELHGAELSDSAGWSGRRAAFFERGLLMAGLHIFIFMGGSLFPCRS